MKRLLLLFVVAPCLAFNALTTTGPACNAHPGPPTEYEFYWDDGILTSGWCWWTGGDMWAVQFDDQKTGGVADALVTAYGAVTYPNWPDGTYQGCYMHVFDDDGGYPGVDLDRTYMGFDEPGYMEWLDTAVPLSTSTFYVAFEQFGDYPNCDSMGVDAVSGTHDWTGYQGSWGRTTLFGDFMLRCYWEDDPGEDFRPPEVTDMDPEDGAEGVPVGMIITFHVVDDISGVDVATIEFTVEDTSKKVHGFALAFSTDGPSPTGVISGDLYIDDTDPLDVVCTFMPDVDLPYADVITCTVAAGLADAFGNETRHDIVWSFGTEDNPGVENCTWGEIKALY
ncbi:MAG TPA: Ig-like domain-containing protein [bacterium]|nr:Ig-like domain-containing protein [bacterium]